MPLIDRSLRLSGGRPPAGRAGDISPQYDDRARLKPCQFCVKFSKMAVDIQSQKNSPGRRDGNRVEDHGNENYM
jgi:hypothetical protein